MENSNVLNLSRAIVLWLTMYSKQHKTLQNFGCKVLFSFLPVVSKYGLHIVL